MLLDVSLQILLACLFCLCATVIFFVFTRKKRSSLLLLGVCDSGKTTLFTNLTYATPLPSYTSLKENVSHYRIGKEVFVLVDVPGHEKIRYESFTRHKSDTRAVLFVIDSKNIQTELKDVAEFMYNILTDSQIFGSRLKFLIICNKQDLSSAKGIAVIKNLLEKELNTLTLTRVGALAGLDQNSQKKTAITLTKPDTIFKFDTSRLKVDFVECSAVENIDPVKQWIEKI